MSSVLRSADENETLLYKPEYTVWGEKYENKMLCGIWMPGK